MEQDVPLAFVIVGLGVVEEVDEDSCECGRGTRVGRRARLRPPGSDMDNDKAVRIHLRNRRPRDLASLASSAATWSMRAVF